MFGAVIGAGLIAAPMTVSTQTATAEAQPAAPHRTAPHKNDAKPKKEPSPGQIAMHERQKEMRRGMERRQGCRQDREGNEVSAVLERL
jgi:hypothetical protein